MKESMNFLTKTVLLTSFASLAACGGGSSTPATPVTVIDQSQAKTALGLAKANNLLLGLDVINQIDKGDLLKFFTSPNGQTGTTASLTTTTACGTSGTFSLAYKKLSAAAGLTAGDYYTVSFNNCAYSGKPTLSGSLKVSALSTTTLDISSSTLTAYSIPFEILFTNYTESSTTFTQAYNGTTSYPTFSLGQSGTGSAAIASTPNISVLRASISNGTSTLISTSYSNAFYNFNISSAGLITSQANYNTSNAVNGSTPITITVVSNSSGTLATPTATNIVVTNYLGGKITGSMNSSSTNIIVNVDNGNDGTIDSTFTAAYSAL
jgi:hypothetical protein